MRAAPPELPTFAETYLDTLDVQAFVESSTVTSAKDIVRCPICQRVLCSPVVLSCGHTFCCMCHLLWVGQEGVDVGCIVCGAPRRAASRCHPHDAVVELLIEHSSPVEQAGYAERQVESAPFVAAHGTVYNRVQADALPDDIAVAWTDEQKRAFQTLLASVSGLVRLCWFARVGLTKHDVALKHSEAALDRVLDNLLLTADEDGGLHGKVAALFRFMNAH